MRFLANLVLCLLASGNIAIDLACDFIFDHHNGYQCRAVNFSNVDRSAYTTNILGDHLYQNDLDFRNRSHNSVTGLLMWNLTVDYLPGNLTQFFPYLKTLTVKKCGLKSLLRSTEYHGLHRLYLGFNEIDRIPVVYFWHFCKLEILSLFGNRIVEIPQMAFRDLISLKRLSLNSNRLRKLHLKQLVNCVQLEMIDLDNNLLETIDSRLFDYNVKLKRIHLRSNFIFSIGNDFLSALPDLEFALFQNNKCIDDSFPETESDKNKSLEIIQSIFRNDCSPPVVVTSPRPRPTTTAPRRKPEYKPKSVYYFEHCRWHDSTSIKEKKFSSSPTKEYIENYYYLLKKQGEFGKTLVKPTIKTTPRYETTTEMTNEEAQTEVMTNDI